MSINYQFNGVILPYVATVAAPYSARIGSADTPGRSGGYPGSQFAAVRKISLTGTVTASSYAALDAAFSDLCAAHDVSAPAPLICRADGFYYLATVESFADSERDVSSIKYDSTYQCADPIAFSSTLYAPSLTTTGGTFTVLGNKPALSALTLTVSAAPTSSYVSVTNSTTGESFILFPDAAGAFVIDSLAEKVTVGTTDKIACFQGRFISLKPGSNTLTIAVSGGATVSAASISYRARAI